MSEKIYTSLQKLIDFNYSKVDREANTFDVTFKFNNIDFEYLINTEYKGWKI